MMLYRIFSFYDELVLIAQRWTPRERLTFAFLLFALMHYMWVPYFPYTVWNAHTFLALALVNVDWKGKDREVYGELP
jgi:hypothetical protein